MAKFILPPEPNGEFCYDGHVVEETRKLIPGRLSLKELRCYSRYGVITLSGGRENRSPAQHLADLLLVLTKPDGSQLQGWVTVDDDDLYNHKQIERAARRKLQFLNVEPLTPRSWRRMMATAIEQGGSQ